MDWYNVLMGFGVTMMFLILTISSWNTFKPVSIPFFLGIILGFFMIGTGFVMDDADIFIRQAQSDCESQGSFLKDSDHHIIYGDNILTIKELRYSCFEGNMQILTRQEVPG